MISFSLSVTHDFEGIQAMLASYPGRLDSGMQRGLSRSTDYLEDAYKREIPKKTGRTAGTITSAVELRPSGGRGYVGTDDEVARHLEYGTRPHRIRARNAKALRFEVGSRTVFAKYVDHPGTSPHNSLLRAGQLSQGRIERFFVDEVGEVFR